MKHTGKSGKRTVTTDEKNEGFSDEERAAMRERAQELKSEARLGSRAMKKRADGEQDVLAKIAEMTAPRAITKRLHAIIKVSAPALSPKTWYGIPAYAVDGKVVCFFQSAQKFKTRYATLGFRDEANIHVADRLRSNEIDCRRLGQNRRARKRGRELRIKPAAGPTLGEPALPSTSSAIQDTTASAGGMPRPLLLGSLRSD